MNDLQRYFPNNQLQNLADDLTTIKTWDDFARRFLLGNGKSPNTYRSYLEACRQFYDFTGGLHPMQAGTPEWIEQWYDSLPDDLNTKHLRIAGLKFMYRKIQERFPFYTSPFEIMGKVLQDKMNRSKRDESEKDALTEKEYRALLKMLAGDSSLKGLQNYALIRFGVTSGMRAAELVGLSWENISNGEDGCKATFLGKGSKVRTIQLEGESVKAVRRAFRARWGRAPQPTDKVFHALPTGGSAQGITKAAVHRRIKQLIETAKAAGAVRQNLNVSTHTLRHTCATRLLDAGVDIYSVKQHLGHSDINTTARYLHNQADLTAAFAKMNGEAA